MRNAFRGYYRPTDDELNDVWSDGHLIFDTNALLNLFRYTPETREEFLEAMRARRDDLWIPYQVGKEFHERRLGVVQQTHKAFVDISASLEKIRKSADALKGSFNMHPSLDADGIAQSIEEAIQGALADVDGARERHAEYRDGSIVDDIFREVTDLFADRVGPPYSDARMKELYSEADARYERKQPPGYEDADKGDARMYGDFILWMQILDHAEETKRPAIFVTQDAKPDWWYRVGGETFGPRPELIAEYLDRSSRLVHFYDPKRFLRFYAQDAGVRLKTSSISEVEKVSDGGWAADRVIRHRNSLMAERDFLKNQLRGAHRSGAYQKSMGEDVLREFELDNRLSRVNDALADFKSAPYSGEVMSQMNLLLVEQHQIVGELRRLKEDYIEPWRAKQDDLQVRIDRIESEIADLDNLF
ncbi:PIN domain-containing protein [Promicromonospora vindobonensis]|uniref:PIN domain-containing protein n=1 Tax=Promicromonospora vindobonensis TaxID=195748 RepID=A0ABW5VQY1_9MICO